MGRIATFGKNGSHFGLKIFVITANAVNGQELGVRDGSRVWLGWKQENKR